MGTPNDTNANDSAKRPEHIGTVADQRVIPDRRKALAAQKKRQAEASPDANASTDTGLERRRGPGRRRSDFMRSAEEGEMTQEQFLFLMAIDTFKKVNDKTFPTWTDVLEIIRRLGYRKVQASELNIPSAEDWQERADAPAWPHATDNDENLEDAA